MRGHNLEVNAPSDEDRTIMGKKKTRLGVSVPRHLVSPGNRPGLPGEIILRERGRTLTRCDPPQY